MHCYFFSFATLMPFLEVSRLTGGFFDFLVMLDVPFEEAAKCSFLESLDLDERCESRHWRLRFFVS